ncbi:hypothetical protein NDU88_011282 [Pleurodeles waltl]|uniref:Uncharacterized protein n=1 Tax=Pleurodeles waltl TaxID=8319 RepID=A0AAV7S0N4_PLEWA|nr:hypothetical protein NDU88_011282 [Pleurodeles waltl]
MCVACDPSGPAVTPQAIARDDASPCLKAGCEAPHLGGPVRPDCWVLPLGPVSGWVGLKSFIYANQIKKKKRDTDPNIQDPTMFYISEQGHT